MATDGIKIIDGDLAKDLYLHFMNAFHKGDTFEQLHNQFLNNKADFAISTPEYEICVTVYALAFWEIGTLTEDLLNEVKIVIEQKSTVKYYTQEIGEETGEARQKELDAFLKKISKANPNPLKKRKRQPKANLFTIGDVLSFQYPDQTYGTAFVLDIDKISGFSLYSICKTNSATLQPATIQQFLQNTIYASEIPTQDELGNRTTQLSAWVNSAERNELEKFSSCFTKIGTISFSLPYGQQIITNNFQKFCDTTIYEQQIAYNRNIGMHIDEYSINDFAIVIE